jgi:hypothetical protein
VLIPHPTLAAHVPPEAVRWVLDHLHVPGNTDQDHAAYFQVSPKAIGKWRAQGLHLGMWKGPTRERWNLVIWMARNYIDSMNQYLTPLE